MENGRDDGKLQGRNGDAKNYKIGRKKKKTRVREREWKGEREIDQAVERRF